MTTFSITLPTKPHIGITRVGPGGERALTYYDDSPGEVLRTQKTISFKKLIAVGALGLPILTVASHFLLGFP